VESWFCNKITSDRALGKYKRIAKILIEDIYLEYPFRMVFLGYDWKLM